MLGAVSSYDGSKSGSGAISVPSPSISILPSPHIQINRYTGDDSRTNKGPKSLADFLVHVPFPKTTEKPPRKVVIKVPCPTTTTTTESPCNCQCCSCNPCEKKKKPKKESDSVLVKTYAPKRHNEVRHPCQVHRVDVEKSSEEFASSQSSEEMQSRQVKKYQWRAHKITVHPREHSDSDE